MTCYVCLCLLQCFWVGSKSSQKVSLSPLIDKEFNIFSHGVRKIEPK